MITNAITVAVSMMALSALAEPNNELIRTTSDQWGFETSVSKTPFVPFGVNFVLNEKRYLNLFGPGVYDRERYERALAALEGLGFNTVKVFLPIAQVLPDPQVSGEARIPPGYLDNQIEGAMRARWRHWKGWGSTRSKSSSPSHKCSPTPKSLARRAYPRVTWIIWRSFCAWPIATRD